MGASVQLEGVTILCGGESRRMGTDKALVDFDGSPLLRRHVEAILSLNLDAPIYISSGTKRYEILDDYGVVYAPDVVAGAGPLSGLAGALIAAEGTGSSGGHVFAMPVDTLVPPEVLLDTLTKTRLGASGVALIRGERLHPVHGLFPVSAAAALSEFVQSGGRAVMGFLETLDIEQVSIDEAWESCLNFNYPEDFVSAREVLAQITSLKP